MKQEPKKQKSVTLWTSEGILEFLKDKSCLVLFTQLHKTKTKDQCVKITVEIEEKNT